MIVAACEHAWKKNGFDKNGNARKRCKLCGTSYVDRKFTALGEMRIDLDDAARAIEMLCEGMSIRTVCRLTGLNKQTVIRLVVRAGRGVAELCERMISDLTVAEVEVDEVWGFCYCKKMTAKRRDWGSQVGDIYTYLAIDRNSKLVLAHGFGKRDSETLGYFLQKLKKAAPSIGQLSTDGWHMFPGMVDLLWGGQINYGQIVKIIHGDRVTNAASRYSPGQIKEIRKAVISGDPNWKRISTSFVERFNLSIRTGNRRMTRLTNGFSKKWANHEAMMNLFIGVFNFCKKHGTLKTSPAVAAGITDHVWTIRELIEKTDGTH
jgi:IS1 family transposase/transposase-like protein